MKRFALALALWVAPALPIFAADAAKVIWSHNTATTTGPAGWGTASPEFATCGTTKNGVLQEVGMKQTPINIDTQKTTVTTLPALTFQYQDNPFEVENTGHVIEVVYGAGSAIRLGIPSPYGPVGWSQPTEEFQLLQFHFHAPSEHTIDGKQYDMELHFVHANQLGDLAVVGVMLKQTPDGTSLLDQIMSLAPPEEGTGTIPGATLNARQLLPADLGYYMYSGSLTTPPCTEGVRWLLMKNPVLVSAATVQKMHQLVGGFPGHDGFPNNNRPVVPTHNRTVLVNR